MKNPVDKFRSLLGNPHRRSWVVDGPIQYRIIGVAFFFAVVPLLILFYFGVRVSLVLSQSASPLEELQGMMHGFQMLWLIGLPVYALTFAYTTLRLSNRIAGPAYAIRRKMRIGRETGEYGTVRLRSGDYFGELANEYNAMVEKLQNPKADR